MKAIPFTCVLVAACVFAGRSFAVDDNFDKGREALDKKDYDTALARFSMVIQTDPQNAAAFVKRGYAYLQKLQLNHAIEDLSEAIRLDTSEYVLAT